MGENGWFSEKTFWWKATGQWPGRSNAVCIVPDKILPFTFCVDRVELRWFH